MGMFAAVLRTIGHVVPETGLAAFRFWGQVGERSGAWIAAADPVHLEARLNHLRLHAFQADELPRPHLRELCDYLQKFAGDDRRFGFVRLGPFAYLRSSVPIATATVSPDVVDGRDPGEFMPTGEHADTHDLLLSELQMALHDHEVNRRRAANGMRTVNSIWIWGGGTAPEMQARPILPLFADDPLFRGYWESCSGVVRPWTGEFEEVLTHASCGFVAVTPAQTDDWLPSDLDDYLEKIRRLGSSGGVDTLTLLGRDGIEINIRKTDALRFWRRVAPLLREIQRND